MNNPFSQRPASSRGGPGGFSVRLTITTMIGCVAALVVLGMVMLFSASTGYPAHKTHYLVMQPLWCLMGVVACVCVAMGDYRKLRDHIWIVWVFWAVVLVLLVLVLPPFGRKINGAYRWIRVQGFTLQPSELAKIVAILLLAWYGERYRRGMGKFVRGLVVPGLFVGPLVLLVFVEPDLGTTLLLSAVTGIMLFLAGTRLRWLIPVGMAGLLAVAFYVSQNEVRRERIMAFLHPEQSKEEVGYQTYQSIIALGSGGLTGIGLGDGRQKLGAVPEHHTDFIFAVIGEELGLVATMGVVVAFVILLICGSIIASRASDTFGFLIACGLTLLISLQAAINMGVVTGCLPNKGLSLPFISYGGSNMVVMLASIGMLINIARHCGEERVLPGAADTEVPR